MPRQRNAFEGSAARRLETPGAEAPVRKRKKPELRAVETAVRVEDAESADRMKQGEIRLELERAKSADLYRTSNEAYAAYLQEKNRKKPTPAKLEDLKARADETQQTFRAQKNKEYDLASQVQSRTYGVEDLTAATEKAPAESRERGTARRDVGRELDAYLQEREAVWEMVETYKETPIESRMENARESREWQERLKDAQEEAERMLEQDRQTAKAAGMDDETFYNTYLARVNARMLNKETVPWMKRYLRGEQNRINIQLKKYLPAEAPREEPEGPELAYEDMTAEQTEAVQELERAREERKLVQDEISAWKRTSKKLESKLSKYGDPFELTNDLARPNLGLGERFGRFLGRITGQSAAQGSYDQLIEEWKENAAKLQALELKLDAAKRGEIAAKQAGELSDEQVKDILAKMEAEKDQPSSSLTSAPRGKVGMYGRRGSGYAGGGMGSLGSAFERHGAVSASELSPASSKLEHVLSEEEQDELANIREIMDAAVTSYETKRTDGVLTLQTIASIENTLKDLDQRTLAILGSLPPYNQEAIDVKFYLQSTLEILEKAKAYLQAHPSKNEKPLAEPVEEIPAEDVEVELSLEETQRLVPDEIFRYNKFKQAFLEKFQLRSKDSEKKRETVALQKTKVFERLRKALDAEKGMDLADAYVKNLAEYRLLQEKLDTGKFADRKATESRLARLKNGLEAVKVELNLFYETGGKDQNEANA